MQDGDELLSVNETAARLGVSPDAVRKRIRRGTLPAHKRDGVWYVRLANVSETRQAARDLVVQDTARDAALAYLERERDQLLRDNDRLLALVEQQQATIAEHTATIGELVRQAINSAIPRAGGEPAPFPARGEGAAETPATPPQKRSWWQRLLGR